jgi:glycosyltransferase involved in cell wall biosynthesis
VRVAIDARPAIAPTKTGVGYYTWNLIHALPRVDPDTTYLAWYLNLRRLLGRPGFFTDIRAPNFAERWTPFPARWFWLLSRKQLPRVEWFLRFDVFFATNYLPPPVRRRPVVVTVHDLAFKLLPETAPHASQRWLAGIDDAVRRAAGILVPSESTKRDLVRVYDVDPDRVTAALLGVDRDRFSPAPPAAVEEVRSRYGLDGPYLLFLGGIEQRKNVPRIIEAWGRLPRDLRPRLAIAGGAVGWDPEGRGQLDRPLRSLLADVRRDVVFTGYVTEEEKVALLSGAVAFVYPSLYEGFGLPVAEALACGTPVVTSGVSSLPEVAGDAAVYVEPADVGSIADGIRRVLEDDELRGRLRRDGPRRAAELTWDRTARATAGALRRAGDAE